MKLIYLNRKIENLKENDVIVNKEKFVSIQYLKEHYHFGTDYNLGHHVIDQGLGHQNKDMNQG